MFYIIKRNLWNIWYKPDSVLSPVNFAGCSSLAALWSKFDDADSHYPIIAILARWKSDIGVPSHSTYHPH